MPTMLRLNDKTKKIAYKILGTPPNLQEHRDKKEELIQKRLQFEETARVR